MEHHQNQLILVTLSGYFGLKLSCARISARRAGEPALLLPRNGETWSQLWRAGAGRRGAARRHEIIKIENILEFLFEQKFES